MQGGFRAGAGRKKGFAAKNAEEARKILSERVAQEIVPLTEMLISQAKTGDIRAVKELLDRSWGRAPQAMVIRDESKLPLPMMNFDFHEIDEKILERFHFTDEERAVLERRLIPNRDKIKAWRTKMGIKDEDFPVRFGHKPTRRNSE